MDNVLYSKLLPPVNGYSVLFEALSEDIPVTDGVDASCCQQFIDDVKSGDAVWFVARVTVSNGVKTGIKYLGGCAYKSFSEFHTEYASDYLADMIDEAIEKAE